MHLVRGSRRENRFAVYFTQAGDSPRGVEIGHRRCRKHSGCMLEKRSRREPRLVQLVEAPEVSRCRPRTRA